MPKITIKDLCKLGLFIMITFIGTANALNLNAADSLEITYTGQDFEKIILEKDVAETRYKTVQEQSTCTKEVPYTENICRDETKYRTQCHMSEGRQVCRNEYENICHYETRYRQICHNGPGQRVCRTRPGRRVCRNVPGARRCRTNRRGQEVCKTTPSRQVCRTNPGREVCNRTQGRRICRQESYQDRVCRNVPRNRCHYEAPRQICNQIPYQENVCRDVTKYRTQTYACMKPVQVPYQVTRKINANIDLNFQMASSVDIIKTIFKFNLLPNSKIASKASDRSSSPLFVFQTKDINSHVSDLETKLTGEITYRLESKDKYLAPFKNDIFDIVLARKSLEFNIINPKDTRDLDFYLTIERKGKEIFNGKITSESIKWHELEESHLAVINFSELGFKVKKKKDFQLRLTMKLKSLGSNLLNPPKEEIKKTINRQIRSIK